MANGDDIQIELVKLARGERLIRLADPLSGLALERKVDPNRSLHDQKRQLVDVFKTALRRVELTVA